MRKTAQGELVFNEQDIIDLIQSDPERRIRKLYVEPGIITDNILELDSFPNLYQWSESTLTQQDYDRRCQQQWLMPEFYKTLDVAQYVLDKCDTQEKKQRVAQELLLFSEREMTDLLRYLIYLVDLMRKNGIVWGVGRGSSVASYVLFLIGIHKIDSMYYDLDIYEFLKPVKSKD